MITFVAPPPGLTSRNFDLLAEQDADGVFTLASRDEPGMNLLVLDPSRWLPDYSPRIPSSDLAAIGSAEGRPLILVVANAYAQNVHVNLMAPVVVNPDNGAAVQTILEGQGLKVDRELVPVAA